MVRDKFHLEPQAVTMHEEGRAHIVTLQSVGWQIASQCDAIEFSDLVHNFAPQMPVQPFLYCDYTGIPDCLL